MWQANWPCRDTNTPAACRHMQRVTSPTTPAPKAPRCDRLLAPAKRQTQHASRVQAQAGSEASTCMKSVGGTCRSTISVVLLCRGAASPYGESSERLTNCPADQEQHAHAGMTHHPSCTTFPAGSCLHPAWLSLQECACVLARTPDLAPHTTVLSEGLLACVLRPAAAAAMSCKLLYRHRVSCRDALSTPPRAQSAQFLARNNSMATAHSPVRISAHFAKRVLRSPCHSSTIRPDAHTHT
jgi:hypothetical protein